MWQQMNKWQSLLFLNLILNLHLQNLHKRAITMLFFGLFSDKRLKVKQKEIMYKTKSDKNIEI